MKPQHRVFVNEWLSNGRNGKKAALKAGYSDKRADRTASEVLKNKEVKAYIKAHELKLSKKVDITAEKVIDELSAIAFSNINDFVQVKELEFKTVDLAGNESIKKYIGVEVFQSKDVGLSKLRAVSEIKQTKDGISLKLYDKIKALESIGKHLGMFTENIHLTADAELKALYKTVMGIK